MGDDVIDTPWAEGGIRNWLDRTASPDSKRDGEVSAENTAPEPVAALPKAGDEYKAYGRPMARPLLMLQLMLGDSSWEGFPYSDLRRLRLVSASEPGAGPVLLLVFDTAEVRLEGRRLDALYNDLGRHVIPWIRELPSGRDYRDQKETVINRITVKG